MSFASYFGYSVFLKQRDYNRVARQARLPFRARSEWIALEENWAMGIPRPKARQSKVMIGFANEYGIGIEALEKALVERLRRRRGIVGVQCQDCVLVHPAPFGRELLRVCKSLERRLARRI